MKIMLKIFSILFLLLVLFNGTNAQDNEECTIGVASGNVTSDGRPLIWKTRDYITALNNELVYNTTFDINFLSIITAGKTYAWMGVNDSGFAILNSLTSDLQRGTSGFSNGSLMREALGTCATIAEFQSFLDETNLTGRRTRGNFAVLDKTGEAALYEIDGSTYWKYDANNSTQTPYGYIIRTNFALNGDGTSGGGYERFARSSDLIHSFSIGDSLNYKSIIRHQMRDFSKNNEGVSIPFEGQWITGRPYGYIYTDKSICRASSVSATVIQGILSGESEKLTTMWTMLGQPAASITVPYWSVGATPEEANGSSTAPLCDISLQIKSVLFDYADNSNYIDSYKLLDGTGGGLWTDIFPAEDSIFYKAEQLLSKWRGGDFTVSEILSSEAELANDAYKTLQQAYYILTDVNDTEHATQLNSFQLSQNYPNPFNPSTKINFTLPKYSYVTLKIYDLLGQEVATLINNNMEKGTHTAIWSVENENLSSGIYLYRISVKGDGNFTAFKKLILLK
ncbi:MAG: carcinine hydrolase/isopenicillin-N N-acyltransferase family protein [Melioribacteraceae bacterium]|nr:carcinine hydrolase/isopenicillin-N N-acyltransferase family protein [Melioribacteraceae bacterium]